MYSSGMTSIRIHMRILLMRRIRMSMMAGKWRNSDFFQALWRIFQKMAKQLLKSLYIICMIHLNWTALIFTGELIWTVHTIWVLSLAVHWMLIMLRQKVLRSFWMERIMLLWDSSEGRQTLHLNLEQTWEKRECFLLYNA